MKFPDGREEPFEYDNGKPKVDSSKEKNNFKLENFDDGSPSTKTGTRSGEYSGGWDDVGNVPHGHGRMKWDNGVEYKGVWDKGVYHGNGRKLYNGNNDKNVEGGELGESGYEGPWVQGKRSGSGITFFNEAEKHGVLRWEGPFNNDLPHGVGQAYVRAPGEEGEFAADGRWVGDTAIKGPTVEFAQGKPVKGWPA